MGKGKRKKGPKHQRQHKDRYDRRDIAARGRANYEHAIQRSRNYYRGKR